MVTFDKLRSNGDLGKSEARLIWSWGRGRGGFSGKQKPTYPFVFLPVYQVPRRYGVYQTEIQPVGKTAASVKLRLRNAAVLRDARR